MKRSLRLSVDGLNADETTGVARLADVRLVRPVRPRVRSLTPPQQAAFLVAVTSLLRTFCVEGFRKGLRVKGVEGAAGICEMTWAADGRATFEYGEPVREGEAHIVWRRIGTHAISPNHDPIAALARCLLRPRSVHDPSAKQRSRAVTRCQQLALKVQFRRLVAENYQRVAHARSCFARRGSWVRVPSSPPV